jgi:hypothetical protein
MKPTQLKFSIVKDPDKPAILLFETLFCMWECFNMGTELPTKVMLGQTVVLMQMTFLNNVRKVGRLVLSRTSCYSTFWEEKLNPSLNRALTLKSTYCSTLRNVSRMYRVNECCGTVVRTPALYSGNLGFDYRPGSRLYGLRHFVVSISTPENARTLYQNMPQPIPD